ncbi:MAG TPA: non-canonical purine NTP pyrophosphatase [Gemmatimonadaceae bacterium]|nr:non-canonical purine NTP pyrophosphatase [Gemmatimonadaceae bacterium]
MSSPFLLATRSAGKLRELKPLFADAGIAIVDLDEAGVKSSPEEDALERFDTFEENAFAKAHYFLARTGLPTIADDSGLEIRALNGAPGVRSKRWSGRTDLSGQALDDANNAAVLGALANASDRTARYVCVAAYADWTTGFAARGESSGTIVDVARGANGFGYDPYFLSAELGVTFGEAERAQKETISHRGRAFRELCGKIRRREDERTR